MPDGFLLVDKPSGMTSHDVVAKVRRRLATKKVGHAGTLDPMATGVLVLGIGDATRLLQYVVDGVKSYDATIRLGSATITDDREGKTIFSAEHELLRSIDEYLIRQQLASMVGIIRQRPSSVSAIKVGGKTGHQRVREGEVVELVAREVHISSIDLHSILDNSANSTDAPFIDIEVSVRCSSGTYIRAIARDLGDALQVGGHLTELRRTLVSPFGIDECSQWDRAELIPTAQGISKILPVRTLNLDQITEISFGRTIAPNDTESVTAALDTHGNFSALLVNQETVDRKVAAPILVSMKE